MSSVAKRLTLVLFLITVPVCPSSMAEWRQLLPASGRNVSQVATDSAGILYIATNTGLYRSADYGKSWTSASSGLPVSGVSALAVDPNTENPGVLYAGTTAGLFKSIDGGSTWSRLSLPTTVPIQQIAVAPTNSSYIFVATSGDYVYRSLDGGIHWSQQKEGLTSAPNAGVMVSIAVDPTNASHVYTSTWRGLLFSSTDGGETWSQIGDARPWEHQIYIAPSNPSVLYTTFDAYDFGYTLLLRSSDSGHTWSEAGNPGGLTRGASQLVIHPQDPDTVFVSTDIGVYQTTSGGAAWSLAFAPIPGQPSNPLNNMQAIALNSSNTSLVYAGSVYSGLYRSFDGGSTWSASNSGIADSSITGIAICTANPSTIYASVQTAGIMKSNDGGATWAPIAANLMLQDQVLGALGLMPKIQTLLLPQLPVSIPLLTQAPRTFGGVPMAVQVLRRWPSAFRRAFLGLIP
jgi:photosystem II stability/assembly factor-like uncharacterized protein